MGSGEVADPSGLPLPSTRSVDVSGCETGICRRQLHIDRGELRWLPRCAQRCGTAKVTVFFLRRPAADLQRRPDRSRSNPIDADSLGAELLGQ